MARRDPLAVLARVRAVELLAARREFAELAAAAARTDGMRRAAEAARVAARAAASPADYAAWRPAADAVRRRLEAETRQCEARANAARQAMVRAWVSDCAVDRLCRLAREGERRADLARNQARLEEAAREISASRRTALQQQQ